MAKKPSNDYYLRYGLAQNTIALIAQAEGNVSKDDALSLLHELYEFVSEAEDDPEDDKDTPEDDGPIDLGGSYL